MINCKILEIKGSWKGVAEASYTTINKNCKVEPKSSWKTRMILAEHSPIRQIIVRAKWFNIPYWVSTHFVRHHIGIEHWVRSQRTDVTNIDRNELYQSEEVEHEFEVNAQAILNISKVRLCMNASLETRMAWKYFLEKLSVYEPELVSKCVPTCIYKGDCYEYRTCGYSQDYKFLYELNDYKSRGDDSI